jgi:hypothetical protein
MVVRAPGNIDNHNALLYRSTAGSLAAFSSLAPRSPTAVLIR